MNLKNLQRTETADGKQMTTKRKSRIIILGAGFSQPAGVPLGNVIWPEILRRAKRLDGRAARFYDDLEAYIQYRMECDGVTVKPEDVNFEQFMGFLDIEHYLALRGSDTWSSDGNEGQIVVKTLIGQILSECMPPADKIPEIYLEFARLLEPNDMIVTFNYDVLLERSLEAVNKPFRLFGYRFTELDGVGGGFLEDENNEVIVLKLHGSIDWFDKSRYPARVEARKAGGSKTPTPDIIFNGQEDFGLRSVLDGPRYADDPFINIYKVARIEELYRRGLLFHETPWLLSPSTNKIIYAGPLASDHWRGLGVAGEWSRGMAIIGYSLPDHDLYTRQAIYSMVKNYQEVSWDEEILDQKKSPLVLVDLRQSVEMQAELKDRYRFVDYSKAELHFDGFDIAAIDKIFN